MYSINLSRSPFFKTNLTCIHPLPTCSRPTHDNLVPPSTRLRNPPWSRLSWAASVRAGCASLLRDPASTANTCVARRRIRSIRYWSPAAAHHPDLENLRDPVAAVCSVACCTAAPSDCFLYLPTFAASEKIHRSSRLSCRPTKLIPIA